VSCFFASVLKAQDVVFCGNKIAFLYYMAIVFPGVTHILLGFVSKHVNFKGMKMFESFLRGRAVLYRVLKFTNPRFTI
jgi:hypothetical protein